VARGAAADRGRVAGGAAADRGPVTGGAAADAAAYSEAETVKREELLQSDRTPPVALTRLGLVVHPTRDIRDPLGELRRWADLRGAQLVQVPASCQQQRVADQGDTENCDLLVSIGGDGTALAALRAGALAGRPVLPVACGSLGVLSSVPAGGIIPAIERFSDGDWVPRSLPALDVAGDSGAQLFALNDVVVVRGRAGQLRVGVEVDGELFARLAGDGCVVSTPIGSSAYSMAAGGPLLAPHLEAFLVTPLPTHGGSRPPFVVDSASVVRLVATAVRGDARLELDGQISDSLEGPLTLTFRHHVATAVGFSDQEPFLSVLREREVITDSPRILAEDARR
jgi:NAD+ kinase